MSPSQTNQLEQSEIAQNINLAGWRQGSVFFPNEISGLPFTFDPVNEVLIVISQSCSVVSCRFDIDPHIDSIAAKKIPKYNERAPEATGKNQRKLHIKLAEENNGYAALECDINRKVTFERIRLSDFTIIQELSIEKGGAKKLATWFARYYTRIALPDELVKNMRQNFLSILEKILRKDSIYTEVDTIYISFDESVKGYFILRLLFCCRSQDTADKLNDPLMEGLEGFRVLPGKDNIYLAHLFCGSKRDIFLADLDGYDRFSEWDYLTLLGELHHFID